MKLIILQGDHQMETPIDEGSMVIGRSGDADIQISDQGISRRHLRIELDGDQLSVTDLGSRNGFKVRGNKVREAVLDHNEEFSIGDLSFVFQAEDDELPGASLPNDDITPMDAEFISTDEDHSSIPAESHNVPAVKAVPVRGIVPAPPGAPRPSGGGIKNKKFLIMAAVPVLVILIAIIAGSGPDEPVNPVPGPVQPTQSKRERYVGGIEECLVPFQEYFAAPSNKASRLGVASKILDETLKIPMGRAKLAPSMARIFDAFKEVNHDYSLFTDTLLYEILESTDLIQRDRLSTHAIKSAMKKLNRWADEQLTAYNSIEPLFGKANGRDPEELIQALGDVQNLDRETIYDKRRDQLEENIFKRIGTVYLDIAQEALAKEDEIAAREALTKSKKYGRSDEADALLAQLDTAATELTNFRLAEEAYDNDDLDLADNLIAKFGPKSVLRIQIDALKLKVDRRRLGIELRQLFTAGDESKLMMISRTHRLGKDATIQNLIAKFIVTINHHKRGIAALDKEDYATAKQAFYDAYTSIPSYDKSNFYKIDAKRYLEEELTPQRLSVKHYERAKDLIERRDNVAARKELDIARSFDPIIGDNEIEEMIELARQRMQNHLRIKAKPDTTAAELKKSLESLRQAHRWLRNDDPKSPEGLLYDTLRSMTR